MFYRIALLVISYMLIATISTSGQSPVPNNSELKEVKLVYERAYGTNKDVVVGRFGPVAVGNNDRVFIGDADQETIHVFEKTGEYITSVGRKGRGPCEFEYITQNTEISFYENNMYVTDDQLQFENSAHVFSLDDWNCSETIRLLSSDKDDFKELEGYYPIRFYHLKEDKLLVVYRLPHEHIPDKKNYLYYLLQDESGNILSDPILRLPGPRYASYTVEGSYPFNAMHSFPFYSESLFASAKDGLLLTANGREFEIRIHTLEGNYVRSIKHPFENKKLDIERMKDKYERTGYMSQLGEGVVSEMLEDEANIPKSWPALNQMFVDDKNQIWVSTIIDDETNEWWVMEQSGEIISKFKWPVNKTIETVKNGFLYTREVETEVGEERIIKYRIVNE